MHEDGRFVKAFPLEFPMGMGDLSQPCLRGDFSTADWVQHKLRYFDGRFVSSARGHRVTWAMFNTALLAASKQSGQAYFRASESHALTKTELRELVESRDDLVRSMATFGADIPTTPMFWKRHTNQLEWIVRQMSWIPPGWRPKQQKVHRLLLEMVQRICQWTLRRSLQRMRRVKLQHHPWPRYGRSCRSSRKCARTRMAMAAFPPSGPR